jgi:hypothetical protein
LSTRAERNAEIAFEKKQLTKAEIDIEQGWTRYQNQQALVAALKDGGHDISEAERLVELLGQTLQQWECHRDLILQRIAHLEGLNRMSIPD